MKTRISTKATLIRRTAAQWLNLVAAPMAISFLAIIITNYATSLKIPWWLWLVTGIIIVIAILLYVVSSTQSFEEILVAIEHKLRSMKFSKPKVLILDGTLNGEKNETPPNPVHTDRTPTDWRSAIEAFGWKAEIGPVQRLLDETAFTIVINPFGEVYPEADFGSNSTASLIREYVWSGGVFVSVSGMPFWYRYNSLSKKQETAGRIEGIFDEKPIWKSLFYDLFPNLTPSGEPENIPCSQTEEDTKRFGDIANAGGSQTVGKFRAYPLKPMQILPMLRNNEQQLCIIGSYLYGQGCFLLAGVFIDRDNKGFEKVVAAIKGWAQYEAQGRKP